MALLNRVQTTLLVVGVSFAGHLILPISDARSQVLEYPNQTSLNDENDGLNENDQLGLDVSTGYTSDDVSELEEPVEELPPTTGVPVIGDETPTAPVIEAQDGVTESFSGVPHETVTERYSNGKPKVERRVTQDKDENYINHGAWMMWDEMGRKVAHGNYEFGKRQGAWMRWHKAGDTELFLKPPFNQFTGPYKSRATFETGMLHGAWVIADADGRKICEWNFSHGRRDGKSTWWYNNGRQMRELGYANGELHGGLQEWSPNGDLVTNVKYINGRRLEKAVQRHASGVVKAEGLMLRKRLSVKKPDDWWAAKVASYTTSGKDEKHGQWTVYFPSGQKKLEGEYQFNLPSGKFNWWHENGQKNISAFYRAGKKDNIWTWWHANGQKSIRGTYGNGSPVGRWTWWHETGKVAQRVDFSANGQVLSSATQPQIVQPNSDRQSKRSGWRQPQR